MIGPAPPNADLFVSREAGVRDLCVVERTIAWLHQYRRLRVRYERRADIHEALLQMGCA